METVGERIVRLREALELSQPALAGRIGITQPSGVMSKRAILFLTFDQIAVVITPRRTVGLRLDAPSEETGLAPHLAPGVELTPEEARHLARSLLEKAALAEAGPSSPDRPLALNSRQIHQTSTPPTGGFFAPGMGAAQIFSHKHSCGY